MSTLKEWNFLGLIIVAEMLSLVLVKALPVEGLKESTPIVEMNI